MRVASLLPSATEILCAIGARHTLVARSHECDHPQGLDHLPALTAQTTHHDPAQGLGSAQIDAAVRAHLDAGLPLYRLDTQRLADLRPDLILTQELCAVCSIDGPSVRAVARHMLHAFGRAPDVLTLDATTLEGVLDDHLRLGRALALEDSAREAVAALRERLFRAEEFVAPFAPQPALAVLEWTDPLYVAGHWTVELIERAGAAHPWNPSTPLPRHGAAIGPQRGSRRFNKSLRLTHDQFTAHAPDALVIAPCGLALPHALEEARRLADQPWFRDLPAARSRRVAVVDGSAMFNRPGPRLIDAFEFLVGWLHDRPELIPSGFPWCPLTL